MSESLANPSPQPAQPAQPQPATKTSTGDYPWWWTGGVGVFFSGWSIYQYFDLTKFELEGGSRELWWFFAGIYNRVGKWGVVGALALISGFMLFMAGKDFLKQRA